MRLSEWQQAAPTADAMNDRVVSVLAPALADLGAEPNPECWVAWGEDPDLKYSVLAPTPAGLIHVAIRLTTPIEGPRATAKLIRWSKVAIGELSLESTGSYRMVAVQVEGLVIKGMDDEADRICAFVRGLIAGTDGRQRQMAPTVFMGGLPGAPVTAAAAPASSKRASVDALPELPSGIVAANPQPVAEPEPEPEAGDAPVASKPAPGKTAKGGLLKTIPGQQVERSPEGQATAAVPGAAAASPAAPPAAPPAVAQGEPTGPRPIATRAARASAAPEPKPAGKEPPPDPAHEETEQDRARWVGPHPIGDEQARRQEKPRWMP